MPAMKNLLDLKFASTRTVDRREGQTMARGATGRAMKRTLMTLWVSAACLVVDSGSDPGRAQHSGAHSTPSHGAAIPQAGSANAVVEFENESVVVVRIRMAPGEKTPMHDITSARLVVWLTDAYLRDTHPDGRTDELHRRAGDIDWVPVQRHAGENLAQEPLEFLAIVPKGTGGSMGK
jgi:hypothetical protein